MSKLIWAGFFLFSTTSVQAVTVTPIVAQPYDGPPPIIAIEHDHLIIAQNITQTLAAYNLPDLTTPQTVKSISGNLNLTTDPSGWVASCTDNGERLVVFQLNHFARQWAFDFDHTTTFGCTAISIEMLPGGTPTVWLGSSGDRRVAQINPFTGSILKELPAVTGAFHFHIHKGIIFGLNELLFSNHGVPYIFRSDTGATLVGNPTGENTNPKLTRGYGPGIFVDEATDSVFYLRPADQLMHRFSLSNPSIDTMGEYKLSITMPRAVSRFGNCLAVLGYTADRKAIPQWVVLDSSRFPELREVRKIGDLGVTSIWSSMYQSIDSAGAIYISGPRGVNVVRGMFDGLNCQ